MKNIFYLDLYEIELAIGFFAALVVESRSIGIF